MLLKKISLTNFRQFKSAEIAFERGLTAIVGPNGSGKTTILEAIAWVLYGEQRGNKDSLRNKWAEDGAGPSVTLEFELGNRAYRVERDLKKATATALLPEGDVIHATSLSAVCEWSEKTIGLSYEQFKNSFCTEQKQLEFLKFQNQERRQEEIAKMLGYDALREAGGVAERRARDARNELKGYQDALDSGADKEAELKAAKDGLATLEKELAGLVKTGEEILANKPSIEAKRDAAIEVIDIRADMEVRKDVGREIKKRLDEMATESDSLAKQAAERDSLKPKAECWEQLTKSVAERKAQQIASSTRITKEEVVAHNNEQRIDCEKRVIALGPFDLDAAAKAVSEAEANLAERREAHARAITAWQVAKANAESSRQQLELESAQVTSELDVVRASEAKGICATCGQTLPDGHAPRSDELLAKLTALGKQLTEARQSAEALIEKPTAVTTAEAGEAKATTVVTEARQRQDGVVSLAKTKQELQKQIGAFDAKNAELAKEIAALPTPPDAKELAKDEQELATLAPMRERFLALGEIPKRIEENKRSLENARASFAEEKARQEKATARLKEIGMDKESADAAIAAHMEFETNAAFIDKQLTVCKANIASKRILVEKAERDAAELIETRKRAKALEHTALLNSHLDKGMSELRQNLNKELPNKLCAHASESLSALTGGRYSQLKLDSKLNPRLVDDDDIEKDVISGGEEDIVALALRMGLTAMMQDSGGQPMSLLILDEVFGSLDDERRVHVMEMLDTLRGMYEQVLFISHIEDVRNAADQWLEITYDRNAKTSRVVTRGMDLP